MRAILYRHPSLCIPPESYVLGYVVRQFRRYSFLPWDALVAWVIGIFETHPQFSLWNLDLREFRAQAAGYDPSCRTLTDLLDGLYRAYLAQKKPRATRWGDKTALNTFHLPRIHAVFPHAQYVHMMRDGRDVVSSFLTSGLYEDVELLCRRWELSIREARRFARRAGEERYLEIRYETLVQEPEATIREVARFLEIEFVEDMLHPHEDVACLGDAHLPHFENLRKPINVESIGRWERDLAPHQRRFVTRRLGAELKRLGYL